MNDYLEIGINYYFDSEKFCYGTYVGSEIDQNVTFLKFKTIVNGRYGEWMDFVEFTDSFNHGFIRCEKNKQNKNE